MRRVAFAIALLLAGASSPALADFAAGLNAYDRGDYAVAIAAWQPMAEAGDAVAQSNIGVLYDKGYGVPQDYSRAAMWYRRAAEQDYAVAQYNLALLYLAGLGVVQDEVEGFRWLRQAAKQGLAKAQYRLAVHFVNGDGLPTDYARAFVWFTRAARQGLSHASAGRDYVEQRMNPDEVAIATAVLSEPDATPVADAEPVLSTEVPLAAPRAAVAVVNVPVPASTAAAVPKPKPQLDIPAPTTTAPDIMEIVPAAGPSGAAAQPTAPRIDKALRRIAPARLDLQSGG